jgi:hypothetical protein
MGVVNIEARELDPLPGQRRDPTMNRFKCPACGGNQYTACDTAQNCIYCGNVKLEKMEELEPEKESGGEP